ncbi:hypothetical protein MTR_4g092100 [Medicago truncatula]|uniref:Uncharacterized protein n=1 Tax=Medicago truncatula TaxID=3880 RepID=A0A072UQ42_MEDTR|nr:hypothetical protein MTR_4g092100 [Medicago truncatula]
MTTIIRKSSNVVKQTTMKTLQNQLRKHKQQQSQITQFIKRNKITLQYNRDSQRHRRIDFRFEEEKLNRRNLNQ